MPKIIKIPTVVVNREQFNNLLFLYCFAKVTKGKFLFVKQLKTFWFKWKEKNRDSFCQCHWNCNISLINQTKCRSFDCFLRGMNAFKHKINSILIHNKLICFLLSTIYIFCVFSPFLPRFFHSFGWMDGSQPRFSCNANIKQTVTFVGL